jgi:hypothetical protein
VEGVEISAKIVALNDRLARIGGGMLATPTTSN